MNRLTRNRRMNFYSALLLLFFGKRAMPATATPGDSLPHPSRSVSIESVINKRLNFGLNDWRLGIIAICKQIASEAPRYYLIDSYFLMQAKNSSERSQHLLNSGLPLQKIELIEHYFADIYTMQALAQEKQKKIASHLPQCNTRLRKKKVLI